MSELIPSLQVGEVQDGIRDYLRTTFALVDPGSRRALDEFLADPEHGIFLGPYVRTRMPFAPAADGWQRHLEWNGGFTPYGHQAQSFARLSTANLDERRPEPLPTLVTTGTGSGKTESFLYPILDHVQRARRRGIRGVQALILYPMNALANDQASRLAQLIHNEEALTGIRAALYTGEGGPQRSAMAPDGLITERSAIRQDPPDILLTNYKMLDQLLLRELDRPIWQRSVQTLRYIVLDEFHTYDGAQGTDVAMLLRRLQLTLDRYAAAGGAAAVRPTPVATSATLGTDGDPAAMIRFAQTVFGVPFSADAVIGETRLEVGAWSAAPSDAVTPGEDALAAYAALLDVPAGERPEAFAALIGAATPAEATRRSAIMRDLLRATSSPRPVDELAVELFGSRSSTARSDLELAALRKDAVSALLAVLSEVRAAEGRSEPSVDLHLWMRSVSRLDRIAGPTPSFRWFDDGSIEPGDNDDPFADDGRPAFPAIYCRHCGRNGWMVHLAPTGNALGQDDATIRREVLEGSARQRALLFAPAEADAASRGETVEGLTWFDVRNRALSAQPSHDRSNGETWALPVLTFLDQRANDRSRRGWCPACERRDGIRFIGSAVATMLSVAITTVFGDQALDEREKKALVFTDSVQDAAHRAGFVQSRAHVFAFRNAIRRALDAGPASLRELADRMIDGAVTPHERYRLLPPDIVGRDRFQDFWAKDAKKVSSALRERVLRRLQFDLALEFGLQASIGRTLELTGAAGAFVDIDDATLLAAAKRVTRGAERAVEIGVTPTSADLDADLLRWAHGVLERMRSRGAISHRWLKPYIEDDGRRWRIWGGRQHKDGMPAFPPGRDAPSFPRVGATATQASKSELDPVNSTKSWFALWARDSLRVTSADGALLTARLLEELEAEDLLDGTPVGSAARAYALQPHRIRVAARQLGEQLGLRCDVCNAPSPLGAKVAQALESGPCFAARCPGRLRPMPTEPNFYRELYSDGDVRRVVAREHTGLLESAQRLEYEEAFKASSDRPDAPNVLVATPTLEMGIDIGDLSTVMLAGLPKTIASYVQRVGRAGRLSGNALLLAFVEGRGSQLARLADPLATIDGDVRPPATYLDAEEILQRQLTASLFDALVAQGQSESWLASDVLRSVDPDSPLGKIVATAEADDAAVERFLSTFDDTALRPAARERLREWVKPHGGPGTSGLANAAVAAVQRWLVEEQHLKFRRQHVEAALPDLEAEAAHPTAGVEEKAALNAAKAAWRYYRGALKDLRNTHWIGALERAGLLPNYSLIDDSVKLGVVVSWLDPDTGEFMHDSFELDRGASNAIRELVPGATFYARGMQVDVDAVDLGVDGDSVETWAFCPACGYAEDLEHVSAPSTQCPRCGSAAIADVGQRIEVAELRNVSAEVRRDESVIADTSDDRINRQFHLRVAADLDPSRRSHGWFVEENGFGVQLYRDLTIRWLNLGRGESASTLAVAGLDGAAPLFRVCAECGKLDEDGDTNSVREHRPWCSRRTAKDEHTRSLALKRTLRTQGCVLRLPAVITMSSLGLPSLIAAIRLGLREEIGGEPDHLDIEHIVEPVRGSDVPLPALLLHDTVPGGTGYLADLTDHVRVRRMLERAKEVLERCECAGEGKAACHRCLIPMARRSSDVPLISRESALQGLATLLGEEQWSVTTTDPGAESPESLLEQRFRVDFADRLKETLGATITETAVAGGVQLTITVDGAQWILKPQMHLHGTVPDYVLRRHGGALPEVAIYTDGYAYHASPAVNRLADDAAKRANLREHGLHVVAVTHRDLEEPQWFAKAQWLDMSRLRALAQKAGVAASTVELALADPVSQLIDWIRAPKLAGEQWQRIADLVPFAAPSPTQASSVHADPRSLAIAALDGSLEVAKSFQSRLVSRDGALALGAVIAQSGSRAALALDDSPAAVSDSGFADRWRIWLRLSNLLAHAAAPADLFARSMHEPTISVEYEPLPRDETGLPPEWLELIEGAEADELPLLRALAAGGAPKPEIGAEIEGELVPIAWQSERLVLVDRDAAELGSRLEAAGWTVAPDVEAALRALGRS
ncbi:hypothetical protein L332_01830 [Agrococcus pavilionensis RW1]|uniref:DEAD/DEAH box helicase n=1 Tax=Agrococcus pavilionensis RW1 TaxID=1330458 RepID=U1MRB6_9MICO|nr:DEAD/DEAH box helicase [Agrococcus pavilionensis]ERG63195.1 hypothetical protein L332_01830 [Agrococcus pavilionensis RW1]